ncbi:MAG: DUF882 domain-containing protein, partial [Alphaproteobacteria bacterium]
MSTLRTMLIVFFAALVGGCGLNITNPAQVRLVSLTAYAQEIAHEESPLEAVDAPAPGFMALGAGKRDLSSDSWLVEEARSIAIAACGSDKGIVLGTQCRQESKFRYSFHKSCMARDFSVPGCSSHKLLQEARARAKARGYGGVGYYGSNAMIHIDVGAYCYWVRDSGGYNTQECDAARNARAA